MIKMYSTGCPKCNVLKKKLDLKKIEYEIITDLTIIKEVGKANNMNTLPILSINDDTIFLDYKSAIKWLEELE